MKSSKGFTLVELVIVIVILGIMAAVAIPKFVDLGPQARNAAAAGVAGAIASGSTTNYAQRKATNGVSGTALTIANVCTTALAGSLATGVTITAAAPANSNEFQIGGTGNCLTAGDGNPVTCTILAFGTGAAAQNASVVCAN
ncbi:MAG: type II secretion system protein [Pseudomonadota bacterium]